MQGRLASGTGELPDKLFFKIGEVSRIVGVEPYVLRYWETEFKAVRPRKSRGGQRMYRRNDVEALLRIKKLLKDEGFTIAGARKRLAADRAGTALPEQAPTEAPDEQTQRLVDEIERLKSSVRAAEDERARAVKAARAKDDTLKALRREVAGIVGELDRLARR